MIDRRQLFGVATASALVAGTLQWQVGAAGEQQVREETAQINEALAP